MYSDAGSNSKLIPFGPELEKKRVRMLCKSRHEDFQLKVLRGKSHDSKKKEGVWE